MAFTTPLLALGGIGYANVMVISVLERRTEAGVRRAPAATRRHIRIQFLVAALAQACLGGAAGVVPGALIAVGCVLSLGWPVDLPVEGSDRWCAGRAGGRWLGRSVLGEPDGPPAAVRPR